MVVLEMFEGVAAGVEDGFGTVESASAIRNVALAFGGTLFDFLHAFVDAAPHLVKVVDHL